MSAPTSGKVGAAVRDNPTLEHRADGRNRPTTDAPPAARPVPDERPRVSPHTLSGGRLAPEHRATAEEFLAFLDPHERRHTFQVAPDREGAPRRVYFGPLSSVERHLVSVNEAGAAVYVMVSEGDLLGRRTENVRRVRCVFVDLDGAPLPPRDEHDAHAIVRTSDGRLHIYWRVDGLPLDAFARVQRALAATFRGDPSVCDLPRVMRLPGFLHMKRAPYRVALEHVDHNARPLALDELRQRFPLVDEAMTDRAPAEVARAAAPADGDRLRRYVWAAVKGEHDRVISAQEGTRNTTLHSAAVSLGTLVGAGVLEEQDARDALVVASCAAREPLPSSEAHTAITSGLAFGKRHPRELDREAP